MKVLKFGGTSVGSVANIQTLLQLVEQEENPVVVLSAMSGVTNLLTRMAHMAEAREDFSALLKEMELRHFETAKALLSTANQNPLLAKLKILFNELEELLQAVYNLRELSLQTNDQILSYGERCATLLVAQAAAQHMQNVKAVDGAALIKTDSQYGNAKVDMPLTERVIQAFYAENASYTLFVTGFIASNMQDRITTLGRGGSDYTAAIWASALHAQQIEIWTDVNGMMTADPRMVKKAVSVPELSYIEAMELSYFGAKVIYPPTMTPAFLKQIPIVIKNTQEPDFPGTWIKSKSTGHDLPVKGITSIEKISLLNLSGSGMVGKSGFSGRLFSLLSREQINVILITQSSSEHSITFAVKPEDAILASSLIAKEFELEIAAAKLNAPQIEHMLSALAIVGENMRSTPGISGRLFHALGRNGVNVRAIAQGSSEYNISVIVHQQDLSKAVNAVHDAFFTEVKKTLNIFCLGTGQIGKTLFKQLQEQLPFLAENNDLQVRVVGICNTRKMILDPAGIDLASWATRLESEGQAAVLPDFVSEMQQLNLSNSVFVDNTASNDPLAYYAGVLSHSISIVTCNKKGNSAEYEQYHNFKHLARKHGVDFHYETNVGAGLPIIRTLKDLLMSGDKVSKIEAILSGTISYIFNHFKADASFCDTVKAAQDLGYTEPDPREDLNGMDFMRKMLILARDAGYAMEAHEVEVENILPQSCLEAKDVEDFYVQLQAENAYFEALKAEAAAANKVLRYIGSMVDGKVKISLQMVDENHPFYMLSGSDNIISFSTDRYAQRPLVVKGPGAGAEVTAAGVFADIINVASKN